MYGDGLGLRYQPGNEIWASPFNNTKGGKIGLNSLARDSDREIDKLRWNEMGDKRNQMGQGRNERKRKVYGKIEKHRGKKEKD